MAVGYPARRGRKRLRVSGGGNTGCALRLKGPLAGSYAAAAALVVFALTPYLALSTALPAMTPVIGRHLGLSPQALALTDGMSNAAYAFGTIAAVQLAMHLHPRRLLILYAGLFVLGSVLAAGAWSPAAFIAGHLLQGMCTSLMLIAAVPPLVTGWPVGRTRWTGAILDVCIFGAVALGPLVGGIQAAAHGFGAVMWSVTGVGALALLFALLTFEDEPPKNPDAPWDWVAQSLALFGCVATFLGASELTSHRFVGPLTLLPMAVGVCLIVTLLVYEYNIERPLMPLRLLSHTMPTAGVLVAMTAGAASVALTELTLTALQPHGAPAHASILFWPEIVAALAASALFGVVFATRCVAWLALGGLLAIAAGGAVLGVDPRAADTTVLVGTGLFGVGTGASVSPALFVAGFSLRSQQVQVVFAVVELLRAVAAFITGPVLLHLAKTVSPHMLSGLSAGLWAAVAIALAGAVAAVAIIAAGGRVPHAPELEPWLAGERPALRSPPLLAALRDDVSSDG